MKPRASFSCAYLKTSALLLSFARGCSDKGAKHKAAAKDPSAPPPQPAKKARTTASATPEPGPLPGANAAPPEAALPAAPVGAGATPPGATPLGATPLGATPLGATPFVGASPPDLLAADPSATINVRASVFSACTEDWAKSYELVDGAWLACRRCKHTAGEAGSGHVAVRITLSRRNWKNYARDHCEKCTAPGAPVQRQRQMGEFAGTRARQH